MGSKGSNTTTTTSSPNQNALGAYDAILSRAGALSNQQYVPYTGELVAGVNNQQNLGIQGINNYANYAQPFIGQAASWAQQAAAPITGQQIQQYSDPFTQQVINATQDQFNNTNNQQLSQVKGNAAAQGALGGNREAIAQAETVNQQQKAQAPVIAGLQSQGYQTGLNTALTEQQNLQNAAYGMANLGISGQQAGMSGAGAQIGAGGLQQQTQQALDTANYGQFMNQQAFPYQQLSWLAGLDTGVGSQMGGTSSTTGPPPNWMSQLIGLGTAGAGAAGKIWGKAIGGGIKGYADGGAPYSGAEDIFPDVQMAQGNTIPKAPSLPSGAKQGAMGGGSGIDLSGVGKGISAIGSGLGDLGGTAATAFGEAFPETAASLVDFLPFLMLARGGMVRGYDEGGGVAPAPYAAAGQPYASGRGYIPSMQMAHGNTIPKAPSAPAHDPAQQTKDIQAITDALTGNKKSTPMATNTAQPFTPTPQDGIMPSAPSFNPTGIVPGATGPVSSADAIYARGGTVRGYAEGGTPDDIDPNPYIPMGDIGSGVLLPPGADPKGSWNSLPDSGVMWPHDGIVRGESLAKGDSLAPKPSFGSRSKIDDPVYAAQNSNGDSWISNDSTTPNGITRENLLRGTGNGVYLEPPTQASPDYKPERTPNPPSQFANQDTQFAETSTPTGGIAPRSGNYTQPLGIADVSHETPQAHSGIAGIDLSKNSKLWDSLMSAGFGMMASRSPFLGVGIGEGGIQGMNTYAGLVKSEQDQANKLEDRKLKQSEIQQKAQEFGQRFDLDERKFKETTNEKLLDLQKPIVIGKDRYDHSIYGRMDEKGDLHNLDGTPYDVKKNEKENEIAQMTGEDYLKTLPQDEAAYLKKVRDYDAALPSAGSRAPNAQRLRDDFYHAYPGDYSEAMYPAYSAAKKKFFSGPASDSIKSFNVSMYHLDTLQKAGEALQHGDIPLFNSLTDWYKKETGKAAPTDFNAIRNIVADEITKAVIGSKGALSDREATQDTIAMKQSPEQFAGIINKYKELMSGQLMGMKQQFTSTTGMPGDVFDRFLLPTTREQLLAHEASGASPPQHGVPTVDQNAYNKLPSGAKYIADGDPTKAVRTKQ